MKRISDPFMWMRWVWSVGMIHTTLYHLATLSRPGCIFRLHRVAVIRYLSTPEILHPLPLQGRSRCDILLTKGSKAVSFCRIFLSFCIFADIPHLCDRDQFLMRISKYLYTIRAIKQIMKWALILSSPWRYAGHRLQGWYRRHKTRHTFLPARSPLSLKQRFSVEERPASVQTTNREREKSESSFFSSGLKVTCSFVFPGLMQKARGIPSLSMNGPIWTMGLGLFGCAFFGSRIDDPGIDQPGKDGIEVIGKLMLSLDGDASVACYHLVTNIVEIEKP